MLKSLPLSLLLLNNTALVLLIVPITEAPRQDLDPTARIYGERGGAFLQDPQANPLVLMVGVILEDVSVPKLTWALTKVAGALR